MKIPNKIPFNSLEHFFVNLWQLQPKYCRNALIKRTRTHTATRTRAQQIHKERKIQVKIQKAWHRSTKYVCTAAYIERTIYTHKARTLVSLHTHTYTYALLAVQTQRKKNMYAFFFIFISFHFRAARLFVDCVRVASKLLRPTIKLAESACQQGGEGGDWKWGRRGSALAVAATAAVTLYRQRLHSNEKYKKTTAAIEKNLELAQHN